MGLCCNCGVQFTLKDEEIICDNCKEIVTYPCWKCKKWFEVVDDDKNKRKECNVCGFFVCPHCGSCGGECQKIEWASKLHEILSSDISHDRKIQEIIAYIEEIKVGSEQKLCPKNVPISYAKERIKQIIVKMQGHATKSEVDKEKFKERFDKILSIPIGESFTITEKRENGSYGQEYRDVVNLGICYGKIKAQWQKDKDDEKKIYILYTRIDGTPCSKFNRTNLLFTECPHCHEKYEVDAKTCMQCIHKRDGKNHKRGYPFKLKFKVSNKDTCQVPRGAFKKRSEKNGISSN